MKVSELIRQLSICGREDEVYVQTHHAAPEYVFDIALVDHDFEGSHSLVIHLEESEIGLLERVTRLDQIQRKNED